MNNVIHLDFAAPRRSGRTDPALPLMDEFEDESRRGMRMLATATICAVLTIAIALILVMSS